MTGKLNNNNDQVLNTNKDFSKSLKVKKKCTTKYSIMTKKKRLEIIKFDFE